MFPIGGGPGGYKKKESLSIHFQFEKGNHEIFTIGGG